MQMHHKSELDNLQKAEHLKEHLKSLEIDKIVAQDMSLQLEQRKNFQKELAAFNKLQAVESTIKKHEERVQEAFENARELQIACATPLPTTTSQTAVWDYRGAAPEMMMEILRQQEEQRRDAQCCVQMRKEEQRREYESQCRLLKILAEESAAYQAMQQHQAHTYTLELNQQAEQKKKRDILTNKMLANEVKPEYFEQFGTSHR